VPVMGYKINPNTGKKDHDHGHSCLYTALDNYYKGGYGKKVSGNQEFVDKSQSFGFLPLEKNEKLLPGHITIFCYNDSTPFHAMIYDSTDEGGDRYNYSAGNVEPTNKNAIKKRGYYALIGGYKSNFKYIGTIDEQEKWKEEYVAKKKEWFEKHPVNPINNPANISPNSKLIKAPPLNR
jgi:hypothetical protein